MANKEIKNSQLVERLILFAAFLAFAGIIVAYCYATEYVPAKDITADVTSFQFTTSEKDPVIASQDSYSFDADSNVTSDSVPIKTGELVNINTATLDELDKLPGIGRAKAEAIIEYREGISRFYSKEDLMQVSGIGEKTFEKLKDLICVE